MNVNHGNYSKSKFNIFISTKNKHKYSIGTNYIIYLNYSKRKKIL